MEEAGDAIVLILSCTLASRRGAYRTHRPEYRDIVSGLALKLSRRAPGISQAVVPALPPWN